MKILYFSQQRKIGNWVTVGFVYRPETGPKDTFFQVLYIAVTNKNFRLALKLYRLYILWRASAYIRQKFHSWTNTQLDAPVYIFLIPQSIDLCILLTLSQFFVLSDETKYMYRAKKKKMISLLLSNETTKTPQ